MDENTKAKLQNLVAKRDSAKIVHSYMEPTIREFFDTLLPNSGTNAFFGTFEDFNGDPEIEFILVPFSKKLSKRDHRLAWSFLRALHPGSGCSFPPDEVFFAQDGTFYDVETGEKFYQQFEDFIEGISSFEEERGIVGTRYYFYTAEVIPQEADDEELEIWARRNRLI